MAELPPVPPLAFVIANAGELGSLPESYHRLNEVAEKPTSTTEQIAEVIESDPGLAARLLRVANSPLFSFQGRIDQITAAVALIGTKQIRDLALATAVIERFRGVPSDLLDIRSFWRHSMGVALVCRSIGSVRREINSERFFVAGLLHDVGSLLLALRAGDHLRVAVERHHQGNETLIDAERAVFGYDHAATGQALLEKWRLPPVLVEAVANHHRYAPMATNPIECSALHLAEVVAELIGFGTAGEVRAGTLAPEVLPVIGFDHNRLADLVVETDHLLDDMVSSFIGEV